MGIKMSKLENNSFIQGSLTLEFDTKTNTLKIIGETTEFVNTIILRKFLKDVNEYLVDNGISSIIVDMVNTEYIGTTFLGVFFAWVENAKYELRFKQNPEDENFKDFYFDGLQFINPEKVKGYVENA
jgi:hypothetical protein